MVNLGQVLAKRKQTIIYGVKRGRIPAALRPVVLPERKTAGSKFAAL